MLLYRVNIAQILTTSVFIPYIKTCSLEDAFILVLITVAWFLKERNNMLYWMDLGTLRNYRMFEKPRSTYTLSKSLASSAATETGEREALSTSSRNVGSRSWKCFPANLTFKLNL